MWKNTANALVVHGVFAKEFQGRGLPHLLSAVLSFLCYGHSCNRGLYPVTASVRVLGEAAFKDTFIDGFAWAQGQLQGLQFP